jgi:hypothetical protein
MKIIEGYLNTKQVQELTGIGYTMLMHLAKKLPVKKMEVGVKGHPIYFEEIPFINSEWRRMNINQVAKYIKEGKLKIKKGDFYGTKG